MVFNEFLFLFILLPLALCLFYVPFLRPYRLQILFVLSLGFYEFAGGMRHVVVLLVSICWVYLFCVMLPVKKNKFYLTLSILVPALALFYFKYRLFFLNEIFGVSEQTGSTGFSLFENTILPAGISFFTFQLISFAIDRYRGLKDQPNNLLQFGFYISFFPQLIAGPIIRFAQISDQIRQIAGFRPNHSDLVSACTLFVFGLAVKVLVADTISRYAAPMLSEPLSLDGLSRLFVVFGYSYQIYFDFLGYSLMAMGLGRIFGFHLPENFRMPYISRTPKEFWRKWHITLSFWVRDYLYLPLGGNKNYAINILIVFALVGLWHGAGWNFIAWGVFHALCVIGYHFVRRYWDRLPSKLQILTTFLLVSVGWTLFIFDIPTSLLFVAGIFTGPWVTPSPGILEKWWIVIIAAFIACKVDFVYLTKCACETGPVVRNLSMLTAVLLCLSLLFIDISETFIYFRF